jgi:hypothetical protein
MGASSGDWRHHARPERQTLDGERRGLTLKTSPPQFYRLLDQTNYRKSVDQLLRLLQALDCDVDVVVREKSA